MNTNTAQNNLPNPSEISQELYHTIMQHQPTTAEEAATLLRLHENALCDILNPQPIQVRRFSQQALSA